MPSVICVHIGQLVDHLFNKDIYTHRIIDHTHAKILVTALERQVSWGDSNGEVVDH